jgi:Flp pilus assembly protein TadD
MADEDVAAEGEEQVEEQQAPSREEIEAGLDAHMGDVVSGKMTLAEMMGVDVEQVYTIATLGHKLLREGRHEEALTIFEGLTALNPNDSNLWVWRGSTLHRMGKDHVEDAITSYTRALEANPKHVTALANRGELQIVKEEYEAGLRDLKAAIDNDPNGEDPTTVRARAILATVAQRMKERQQAG